MPPLFDPPATAVGEAVDIELVEAAEVEEEELAAVLEEMTFPWSSRTKTSVKFYAGNFRETHAFRIEDGQPLKCRIGR